MARFIGWVLFGARGPLLAGSRLSLSCNWGSNGLWLPILTAGKNDCFAAGAVGRWRTPSSRSRLTDRSLVIAPRDL
jgi:hypothetical protein